MKKWRKANTVWTISSVTKTFILIDEQYFPMYMMAALGSAKNGLIEHPLDDGHTDLLCLTAEIHDTYERFGWDQIGVIRTERKRFVLFH